MSLHALESPSQDGGTLFHPPLDQVPKLLADNARTLSSSVTLLGRPSTDLRAHARRDALAQAKAYLAESGEPVPPSKGGFLLVAGHQPDLFHPGVWLKNFVLQALARRLGGIALNLVVDNDVVKHASLRVPTPIGIQPVPYDHWQGDSPYEERAVVDEELFASLPARVRPLIADWPFQPMLEDLWRDVRCPASTGKLAACPTVLGERFARARRAWERRWGLEPLEVPLIRLCRTEAFAWFACALLDQAERFRDIYNQAVGAYRRRYNMRSRNHPVPDLAQEGDWFEAPLWAWKEGAQRRGRLLVRRNGRGVELRAGQETLPALPSSGAGMLEAWQALEIQGWKIRPRALSLTLFVRLFIADLFVHGLGGGKYDEVTDELFRGFFGIEPPAFLVATGTLLLPLPRHPVGPADLERLSHLGRDLHFNPQRHVSRDALLSPIDQNGIREKARLLQEEPASHVDRRNRFLSIRGLNEALRPLVADRALEVQVQRGDVAVQLERNAILSRRDYSFCLYPEEKLRPFLQQTLDFY